MTVSTVVDHNDYTGNGVTTSFPYTFRIFKKTDLAVSVVDLNENITVLVLDTDYTVTNAGGYNGGNVVLTAPLATGWQISIARELEPTQETDLRNQGKFFAEVHEDAFDKLTMLIQQAYSVFRLALRKPSSIANWYDALNNYIRNLRDPSQPQDAATKNYVDTLASGNLSRTLRVPEPINQLPPAALRKNTIPAFDDQGNAIVIAPPSGSASDVMLLLAAKDGYRYIGECADISTLKTTEPASIGQLIRVKNYYSDKFGGGGFFRSVNPGSLVDDGGLYIKTSGGAVWRRVVENNTITTADYGCYSGNVGVDNSTRLVKACASGCRVVGLGENYNMTTITTSNLEISGKFTPSKTDFTASYGRVLLIFTGGKVKGDIFVDMLQFSAGGVIIRGSECEMSIRVENIEAGDRTVFGLQNGVQDEGLRNQLSIFCRAIHDAFGQVIPVQPAAFTIADTGGGGTYPVIDITDCNTAVINNGQGRGVHVGTYTARSIKYNVWYNLAGAYSDISDLFVENISGQVLTNSGGQLRVGRVYIKECTGYGINFSYNSSTTINEIIVDNHSPSSQMPLLWCRDTNEVSSLHVGSIKGTMTLAGGAATPGQGCMAFEYGINNITIGEVDLVMNYIASSYLGIISFLKCRSLVLGKWRLTLQDTTGTLTSSSIAFITPPDTTLVSGSSFGLQQYISTPARMQFNINGQQNISFAAGQPISSASGPYITSLVPNPVRIFQCPGLPTSGKWFSGDVVIVTTPSPTVKLGYRCIATGDFAGTAPTFQLIA